MTEECPSMSEIPSDSAPLHLYYKMECGARPSLLLNHVAEKRLSSMKLVGTIPVNFTSTAAATCMDIDLIENDYLLCGSSKGSIDVVNLNTFESRQSDDMPAIPYIHQHRKMVNVCQWFSQGLELFVSASQDNTVKLWDLNCQRDVETYCIESPVQMHWNQMDSVNPLIAVCNKTSNIPLIDLRVGQDVQEIRNKQRVTSVRWYPSDTHLLSVGDCAGNIFLYDIRNSRKPLDDRNCSRGEVGAIRFTSDGMTMISVDVNRLQLHLWDTTNKSLSLTVSLKVNDERIHDSAGRNLALCEDGKYLRVGIPSASSVVSWITVNRDLSSLQGIQRLSGHLSKVSACQYRPGRHQLFSSSLGAVLWWSSDGERACFSLKSEGRVPTVVMEDDWSDDD